MSVTFDLKISLPLNVHVFIMPLASAVARAADGIVFIYLMLYVSIYEQSHSLSETFCLFKGEPALIGTTLPKTCRLI